MTGDDELDSEVEELVTSFYKHLTVEKGLSEKTASRHVDEIEFFAMYLTGYGQGTLLEVTGMDIEEYLGDWYIRKVASSRSDLRQIPVSFKKFYRFLHEKGHLKDEELEDILDAFKNPDRYIRRLDAYLELDPYSDTWNEDYEQWFFEGLDGAVMDGTADEPQPFDVDSRVSQAVSEADIESGKTSLIGDFQTFLRYIISNNGMKLTTANSFIRRKDIFTLNKLMESPEDLKGTANQPDSRTIHLFYNLAKTLNLVVVNEKNGLEVTPRIGIFMNLPPKEQFIILFDVFWNHAEWGRLLPPQDCVDRGWVQASRGIIAAHLAACEPGRRYHFAEETRRISMKIGGIDEISEVYPPINFLAISVFAERIMPALKLFGLLDFEYAKERAEYATNHGWGIEWFSISTLGGKILGGVHADTPALA
uniref:Tyrosine recombinase XerC n=1 Tax=Candidatus Methanogaster sp. ANME-2c ERB4 TaxID=2759911 RepID=A0A7G9YPZ7_9EURY|nr:tyrosine recombinase XerC [Methanosarcinales archaeon ANME-2c ERB4]